MTESSRRKFLKSSSAAMLTAAVSKEVFADYRFANLTTNNIWDSGQVSHLLPTVNDTEILIKASFRLPQKTTPILKVGNNSVKGRMEDTQGQHWSFYIDHLSPRTTYLLSLLGQYNKPLCQPWQLATFPGPTQDIKNFRLLIYSCAGGHELHNFLPIEVRRKLLQRGLSFKPDALVANGDHVYWDLLAPVGSQIFGKKPESITYAGTFDRSSKVIGTSNESVLKKIAETQIASVYGTDFRSTPVFFLQDDHDYFDNDEATDEVITFPPSFYMMQLARSTQSLYYPEFLADRGRPLGLPWSSAKDKSPNVSESFGTLRFGNLAEILLYDVRRTLTLAGPSAVYLDQEVERWIQSRTKSSDVKHVVHVPSNPPGWTAGKWGEWYPDFIGKDGKLGLQEPKPYWQSGWLKQHDRLMQAISTNENRIPLVISGDLHATGLGQMQRSGSLDFSGNPINVLLSGPIGCRPDPSGWPSGRRGTGAKPSQYLDFLEDVKPIEQHGFTVVDFTPNEIKLQMFKWDIKTQSIAEIDTLSPFHTKVLNTKS